MLVKKCTKITEKRKGLIFITEECGNNAKNKIQYKLNDQLIVSYLCGTHSNYIIKWLDRIKIKYYIINKNQFPTTD